MRDLLPHSVHLHWVRTERADHPEVEARVDALLDPEEAAQRARFAFDDPRKLYGVAHALVREALSLYHPLPPERWRFTRNAHGRPDVVLPEGAPRLRCNLSHTQGLAVCAITVDRDLGVDVEDRERNSRTTEIADSFFAPSEVRDLRALPPEHQRARFFSYWTLKEAYMKARGIGLALGLDNFAYRLHPEAPIEIAFTDAIDDDPRAWQFRVLDATPRHPVALAVRRRPDEDDLSVRCYEHTLTAPPTPVDVAARDRPPA